MGSRERLILILLALALAGGLTWLVVAKGRERQRPAEPIGSIAPEGWDLTRVPSYGAPVHQQELESGMVVQTVEDGQGDPIPGDRPVDVHYRIFTVDGVQRGRGVYPQVTWEGKGPVPAVVRGGLAGARLFEKRRLLIRAKLAQADRSRRVPPGQDVVYDLQPVELVVEDLTQGTGRVAELGQHIKVHYVGNLEDGTTFDSSHRRGRPTEFWLVDGGLIKGWTQGIPGMRVGGKRRLWVPHHLAYGPKSPGEAIPPYSNLIFEIELVSIRK